MDLNDIRIRTTLTPGDIGYIIHLHGSMYKKEYGYGISFETYVAKGFYEFHKNYDAEKDAVWICEHNDSIIGFLLLMHRENNMAQLRFFILLSGYRGIGLGKKLMDLFINHLTQKNYSGAYLWTTNEQTTATALYSRYGFVLTEEHESSDFGKPLKEQRYELILQN